MPIVIHVFFDHLEGIWDKLFTFVNLMRYMQTSYLRVLHISLKRFMCEPVKIFSFLKNVIVIMLGVFIDMEGALDKTSFKLV